MVRRFLALTLVAAFLGSSSLVWAQGRTEAEPRGVELRYKFEEGQKFVWTAKNKLSVEIEEMPEEFEGLIGEDAIDVDFNMTLKLRVKEVQKGKTIFEGKFQKLSVKGNMIIQEIDFEFDADRDDPDDFEDDGGDEGFGDFGMDVEGALRNLVKEPIELSISDRGKVEILSTGAKEGAGGGLAGQFLTLNGFMGELPKKEVEEGSEWKTKSDFGIPNLPMKVKLNAKNTYEKTEEVDDLKAAVITSEYEVGTGGSDDDAPEKGDLPFEIDAKMTGKGKGTTYFAIEAGRVLKGEHKVKVDVEANLENPATGDDMTIKAKLTMSQETKMEVDKEKDDKEEEDDE